MSKSTREYEIEMEATTNPNSPFYLEECGSCGSYHRPDFEGDCREDSERFPHDQALYDLFMAATDLLGACKAMLAAYAPKADFAHPGQLHSAVRAARAAIDKAERR